MEEYEVVITEELVRAVKVQAQSEEEAMDKVEERWRNAEIILNADDFSDVKFYASKTE